LTTRRTGSALLAATFGCAILIGLGVWQLYRLQWKDALIAEIETRLSALPVSLNQAIDAPADFLRVKTSGTFDHRGEMFVLTTAEGKPGWQVVTPLKSEEDAVVLVDRGFVPDELRDPAKRPESQPQGRVDVSGYVGRHGTGPGPFTPDNDAAANNWYWWDIPAMLAFGHIDPGSHVAPFALHALPGDGDTVPRPQPPLTGLTNNHLQYALTWFGLAIVLAVVAFFFIRGERTTDA
jgi:surfeit locus 1 family protein